MSDAVLSAVFAFGWGFFIRDLVEDWRRRKRARNERPRHWRRFPRSDLAESMPYPEAIAQITLGQLEPVQRAAVAVSVLANLPTLPQDVAEPVRVLAVQARRFEAERAEAHAPGAAS